MVTVLGIESTAHTFGVGIATSDGRILSDERSIYISEKGIHPREAAEHHSKNAYITIRKALEKAGIGMDEIDGVAFSMGPGLGPCLRVGATVARVLALKYNLPLIPVNHAIAHIEIARLTSGLEDPVILYVAGGHTTVTTFVGGRYRVFGETLDIPLGNCLDTFAREMGLGAPGVPRVEECGRGGKYVPLPYVVKGQDVSFSGLLTRAIELVKQGVVLRDVCYSIVETAYSMVVEVVERAMAHTGKKEVTLTGGLARSRILVEKLETMVRERGGVFRPVDPRFSGDNGAMIAYTGALALEAGVTVDVEDSGIKPLWRFEEVEIPWRRF